MSKAARKPPPTRLGLFERARIRIRSAKSLAIGLKNLRYESTAEELLRLSGQLAIHPSYKNLIWRDPFPKDLSKGSNAAFPFYLEFKKELAWVAGLLLAYSKEISDFLTLRKKSDFYFLTGQFEPLNAVLSEIENAFGLSIWLLDRQYQLAIATGDLRRKSKIANLLQSENKAPPTLAVAVSWLQYRALSEVSYSAVYSLLDELMPLRFGADHLIYVLLGRCPSVSLVDARQMLSHTDTFPAVDRYETLILTLQALAASGAVAPDERSFVLQILGELAAVIPDPRLHRLLLACGIENAPIEADDAFLDLLDKYSRGSYADVVATVSGWRGNQLTIEAVNVAVRAAAMCDPAVSLKLPEDASPLLLQIAVDLALIAAFSEQGIEARTRLQKIVLSFSGMDWASSLACILDHQVRDERVFGPSANQAFHGLRSQIDHPALAFAFPGPDDARRYLNLNFLGSRSPVATQSMQSILATSTAETDPPNVPPERALRLSAIRAARLGEDAASVQSLSQMSASLPSRLVEFEASLLLVACLLRSDRIAEAADTASRLYVSSRYFGAILPIRELVRKLLERHNDPIGTSDTRGRVSVAIIFDIYSRYVSSDHDVERADAFKDILRRHNVEKASAIVSMQTSIPRPELIYFLRYVCVPDVLDQSLHLPSTEAVEDERAAILVALSEMTSTEQQPPPQEFKDELREISTRQVVRRTTLQLDQSKIYVNVDGIRRLVEVSLRDNWNRYRLAIVQSAADYEQIESIERYVRTTMGDQVAIIALSKPIAERIATFGRLYGDILEQFTSNKEFGLNSNLSTNIRHGYVLRELRSPLLASNLVTNKNSDEGGYQPNSYWLDRLNQYYGSTNKTKLSAALDGFSKSIDEVISRLNGELLRIRSDISPNGLFDYTNSEIITRQIEARLSQIDKFDEFVEGIFENLWAITEKNLARVRATLVEQVLTEFNSALSKLEEELRDSDLDKEIPGLMSVITMARPDIRAAIERVESWFRLSGNNEFQDFDLEIAYQAGLKTIRTYYANIKISEKYSSAGQLVLRGWSLPLFVRLFFQLLDNAGNHGAKGREEIDIEVLTEVKNEGIFLSISNDLGDAIDVEKLSDQIATINSNYNRDEAVERLGVEGGSGYSKVWKLLNDLNDRHDLQVRIKDGRFVVEIVLDPAGILQ